MVPQDVLQQRFNPQAPPKRRFTLTGRPFAVRSTRYAVNAVLNAVVRNLRSTCTQFLTQLTVYAVLCMNTQQAIRKLFNTTQCAISNTGESGLASTQYAICMQDAILYAIGNSAMRPSKSGLDVKNDQRGRQPPRWGSERWGGLQGPELELGHVPSTTRFV